MFPRNIRAIYPWKMAQIQALMLLAIKHGEWEQKTQNSFCYALENANLKRPGIQYDPQSGGPRTYFSQLKCLGLLFTRHGEGIYPTIAGQDLADGKPPLPILQNMLLKHQYPSAYSKFPNVRINPLIKVKPFLFVLELLCDSDIESLDNEELVVPIVYGHNSSCFDICKEKILKLRNGKNLIEIFDDIEKDLYLPKSGKDLDLKIKNILDIANTCKNYMKACCLIYVDSSNGKHRIFFNEDARNQYEIALESKDRFISSEDEESFQRAYGAWDRKKDNRLLIKEDIFDAKAAREGVVLSKFYELCGQEVISDAPDEFLEEMALNYGFSKEETLDIVSPHLNKAIDFFEATFLECAKGGTKTALKFEKSLADLMKKEFGFFAKHTGQIRRPGVGGYADVFIVANKFRQCAILDAKASGSYSISSDDYSKLVSNYIPNYIELLDLFEETRGLDLNLEFSSYVAGGFSGDIQYKLDQATKTTGVYCSAIRARDLIHLAKKGISQSDFRRGMTNSKLLNRDDFKQT